MFGWVIPVQREQQGSACLSPNPQALPFALGVLLVLGGLLWPVLSMVGWPLALLGLGGWAIAVGVKYIMERNISNELEECNAQLERTVKQLKQAKQEAQEIDDQLPTGGGPLDARLQTAQQRLEQLERMLPMETERQEARRQAADRQEAVAGGRP